MNFYSAEQAIKFAFKTRERSIVSKPSFNFFVADKFRHDDDKLTPFDFHAQSAMIFRFIDKQTELEILWTYWTFGNKNEKEKASRLLADKVDWKRFNLERDDIYLVLLSDSVRKCAKNMSISNYKAWKYRRKALHNLQALEDSLTSKLWDWLERNNTAQ